MDEDRKDSEDRYLGLGDYYIVDRKTLYVWVRRISQGKGWEKCLLFWNSADGFDLSEYEI